MGALQVRPVPHSYLIQDRTDSDRYLMSGLWAQVRRVGGDREHPVENVMAKYKQQEFYGSDVRVENLIGRVRAELR